MTDDKLRAALDATLAELAESPLPGARYAYTVVKDRMAAALAASAPDEGPRGWCGEREKHGVHDGCAGYPVDVEDDAWRRELRRRRAGQHTLRSLAERVGVHFTYLSKIENGQDRPSRDLVVRLDTEIGAGGEIVALFDGLPCSRCGRRARLSSKEPTDDR